MRIENAFKVGVPVEQAWAALTDLEGLAPCLPGAQLTGVDGEDYRGRVRVKVGPVVSQFSGTARFTAKDDAEHHAVVNARGKDTRGGGNASAVIDMRLASQGGATAVAVTTDLNISGRLAQFGSGMIKEISEKLLGQFVANLERQLHGAGEPADTPGPAASPPDPASPAIPASPPVPASPATADSPGTPTSGAAPAGAPSAVGATPGARAGAQSAEAPATAARPTAPRPVVSPAQTEPADSGAGTAGTPETAEAAKAAETAKAAESGEPEALDLMSLAGGSVYKRLVPVALVVVVVIAVVVYVLVR